MVHHIPKCFITATLDLKRNGVISYGNGQFSLVGSINRNTINGAIKIADGSINLEAKIKGAEKALGGKIYLPITVGDDFSIHRHPYGKLSGYVQGKTNIEDWLRVSDSMDIHGNFFCDVKIDGTLLSPIINGEMHMNKTYFASSGVLLNNGSIQINIDKNHLSFLKATFLDSHRNKLTIAGDGHINLEKTILDTRTNLLLQFKDFTLLDSDAIGATLTGDCKITGTLNNLLICGNLKLPRCKIYKIRQEEVPDGNLIIENEPNIRKGDIKVSNNKKYDFCTLDIQMDCSRVECVGDMYNLKMAGKLHLLTYDKQPTLDGILTLTNSRLHLFDTRMSVKEGKVIFVKEHPFFPGLELLCRNTLGSISVFLQVSSKPGENISFNLYSVPQKPQDTILAHMLFRKELSYLSVTEAAQLAHAVAVLKGNKYIFSTLDSFKKIGVIDHLSFSEYEQNASVLDVNTQSAKTQNRFSAGKHINDSLYIGVNKENDGVSFDVNFALTPQISVTANSKNEAGLNWKFRY
jgi:autotransporter translocation and assembly factor TamB